MGRVCSADCYGAQVHFLVPVVAVPSAAYVLEEQIVGAVPALDVLQVDCRFQTQTELPNRRDFRDAHLGRVHDLCRALRRRGVRALRHFRRHPGLFPIQRHCRYCHGRALLHGLCGRAVLRHLRDCADLRVCRHDHLYRRDVHSRARRHDFRDCDGVGPAPMHGAGHPNISGDAASYYNDVRRDQIDRSRSRDNNSYPTSLRHSLYCKSHSDCRSHNSDHKGHRDHIDKNYTRARHNNSRQNHIRPCSPTAQVRLLQAPQFSKKSYSCSTPLSFTAGGHALSRLNRIFDRSTDRLSGLN